MKTNTTVSLDAGSFFLPALTLLFIGLKLTGYIAWSWWWVLSPIWLPLSIVGLILLFVFFLSVK